MFSKLRTLFASDQQAPQLPSVDPLHLAVAALMIEAAKLDDSFDTHEWRRIEHLLRTRFGLPEREAEKIIAQAEARQAQAVEIQNFTRTIKDRLDHTERVQMVEMLWDIAYADGELHDFEANLLRRVAGLLYVSDRESGEARKRVMAQRGLAAQA